MHTMHRDVSMVVTLNRSVCVCYVDVLLLELLWLYIVRITIPVRR